MASGPTSEGIPPPSPQGKWVSAFTHRVGVELGGVAGGPWGKVSCAGRGRRVPNKRFFGDKRHVPPQEKKGGEGLHTLLWREESG
jgi:hypothetical protein